MRSSYGERFAALVGSLTQHRREEDRIALANLIEGYRSAERLGNPTPVLEACEALLTASPELILDFGRRLPFLLDRLGPSQVHELCVEGIALYAMNPEAARAFLRLESQQAQQAIDRLSPVVELAQIEGMLLTYCRALTDQGVRIAKLDDPLQPSFSWIGPHHWDKDEILLPPSCGLFSTKDGNFMALKVIATHQAGHIEFGTASFSLAAASAYVRQRARTRPGSGAADGSKLEWLLDSFPSPTLARWLFTIIEDTRIDYLVQLEYPGVRAGYGALQECLFQRRLPLTTWPDALLDALLWSSIGVEGVESWLSIPVSFWAEARRHIGRVRVPRAQVEDSVEATIRLYALVEWLIASVAHNALTMEVAMPAELKVSEGLLSEAGGHAAPGDLFGEGMPLGGVGELAEATPTEQPLLGGQFGVGARLPGRTPYGGQGELMPVMEMSSLALHHSWIGEDSRSYYYDEWDFRARDYRSRWCRLREIALQEGSPAFYEETIQTHQRLLEELRRGLQRLRPRRFRKVKGLKDGEEYELDRLIEGVVERRITGEFPERVYWSRRRVERDVAVALLLDMSASTDEEIHPMLQPPSVIRHRPTPSDPTTSWPPWDDDRDPDLFAPRPRGKRIIDLEKESIALFSAALQPLGDGFAIYGFSGYGRDNAEFYIIKDFEEPHSERMTGRIGQIAPLRGTRMGPAIRHAVAKLGKQQRALRLLLLLSDGYPQDHDYHGGDRNEREYALHDTRVALLEAKRKGIIPFCLTVDKAGTDYLRTMCPDIGYQVVSDIESLPSRLLTLYLQLTS
ncbi:MAG: hypothetical protein HYX89_00240 [Chloroflexi bacterium]|nr:hypothetical protein [Chloroflexota bacterium]